MGKKQIIKTLKGIANLDYPEIDSVPMIIDEKNGEGIHAQVLGEVEHMVAYEIILQRLPIHGAEVIFLRKALSLSRLEFAQGLKLSDVAILKWEKASNKRLALVNEVAVRAYFAQRLKVRLPGTLDSLIGIENRPKKWILQFSAKDRKSAA